MTKLKSIVSIIALSSIGGLLHAALNETATLSASITAGGLEIVPASVTGPHSANGGASVALTGALQSDALQFNIDIITINDLNGDGSGWTLSASPAANLTNGPDSLPLGTTNGFNNPSDSVNTTNDNANQITYSSGAGVVGYTVDYDVAYDVPALVAAGAYSGTVQFVLSAN
ncbi:MAG: hypothetical protein ACI92G_003518 [Candidatus Pelagisphaera sp.]|jgi:hypothetical protein